MNKYIREAKSTIFEIQNSIIRYLVKRQFPIKTEIEMEFLGNNYSGYWFPKFLTTQKGTIWGVGLGNDSTFELELLQRGYCFYGFEPEDKCYEASVKQFMNTSAVIEKYGLWDKTGKFKYTGENISIVNIFDLNENSEQELDIRSLWEVIEEKELDKCPQPRVLKMNIEGAEREILLKFIYQPLAFDVVIFQAEFLYHLGFIKIRRKVRAFRELTKILSGLSKLGLEVVDFSRHQITVMKVSGVF